MRLDPLPKGSLDPELERRLEIALEFEGWQEAETIYGEVHPALDGADAVRRARALMDHAAVLRRLGKESEAMARESEAEKLVGGPIDRDPVAKSSVDELAEDSKKKQGWFKKLFS